MGLGVSCETPMATKPTAVAPSTLKLVSDAPGAPAAPSNPRDTPAMRQYYRFKKLHPGCILLFRIGDFYEMFDEDAVTASRAIGLTLTQRSAGVPMAGLPFHQLENYLRKFLSAGFRVAVCEQTEDAATAKGLVERNVTRVLTPGTLVDDGLLPDDRAACIGAVCFPRGDDGLVAIAVVELGSGQFSVMHVDAPSVGDELTRLGVSEVLYPETLAGAPTERLAAALRGCSASTTACAQWHFRLEEARESLLAQYGVATLAGFGLSDTDPLIMPAGALVRYLRATQAPEQVGSERAATDAGADAQASGALSVNGSCTRQALGHLRPPRCLVMSSGLIVDGASLRSLEVDRTIRAAGMSAGSGARGDGYAGEGSLLGVFASRTTALGSGSGCPCRTGMGKRLLREWLCRPLRDVEQITLRQDAVGALVTDRSLAAKVGSLLAGVQDVHRIGARVSVGRATPRDLAALGLSIARAPQLAEALASSVALGAWHAELVSAAIRLRPLGERIITTCVDDPPSHLRDGGLVRPGVDRALDEARQLQTNATDWLSEYQAQLIAKHDLANLKVGYNRVFGYYIELPKAQATRAPEEFSRRQTLASAERYITPELKTFEEKVGTAEARALEREQAIFANLCSDAGAELASLAKFADVAAELDVLVCFADKAAARRWVRPVVVDEPVLEITQGRHPVLDELLEGEFVPNDLSLGATEPASPALALITGPNMAGKSTFIRQTALIVLLAHTGSFVPAEHARVGLCDRIFTRVGADDALFAGQSTFMVEMTETAGILHHATERSLVVLDEIGRGTSTLDGLSLAWAITERLAAPPPATALGAAGAAAQTRRETPTSTPTPTPPRGPRTLFATHYHELTRLEELMPGKVANLQVAVREWEDQVVFLHRILPGRADRSYGIHVAKLAGVPPDTIERAKQVLESLTVEHSGLLGQIEGEAARGHEPTPVRKGGRARAPMSETTAQLALFTEFVEHPVVAELRGVNLEGLTPMQAFDVLRTLQAKLRSDRN